MCFCYRLGGSRVQQGSILRPVLERKHGFIQGPLGKVVLYSGSLYSTSLTGISRKNIFICVNSGKTEYQTTKASKARRSASFERRPSRRYSRRTMQNRGENTRGKGDTSRYPRSAPFILTCTLRRWTLKAYFLFLCVFVCVQDNWILTSEYTDQTWWSSFCTLVVCPRLSVCSSVSQMPWLTHSRLIHFEALTVIRWQNSFLLQDMLASQSLCVTGGFFKLSWDQLSQSIVKTNIPVTL